MLPSGLCSPFAVEALVLRGLWGEMQEWSVKGKESRAAYLGSTLSGAGPWDCTGQALGAAAESADRPLPHVAA